MGAAGCWWACWGGGRRLQLNLTSPDEGAHSISPDVELESATSWPHCGIICAGGRRLLNSTMSDEELKAAGCRWACWGGGRRLQLVANFSSEDEDAAISISQDVQLEAATSWPHCGFICAGGRRLLGSNMSDEDLKAAGCRWACWGGGRRLQLAANFSSPDEDAATFIDQDEQLEAATSWPHCGIICAGGRRLLNSTVSMMSEKSLRAAGCRWACWGGGRRLQPNLTSPDEG